MLKFWRTMQINMEVNIILQPPPASFGVNIHKLNPQRLILFVQANIIITGILSRHSRLTILTQIQVYIFQDHALTDFNEKRALLVSLIIY